MAVSTGWGARPPSAKAGEFHGFAEVVQQAEVIHGSTARLNSFENLAPHRTDPDRAYIFPQDSSAVNAMKCRAKSTMSVSWS